MAEAISSETKAAPGGKPAARLMSVDALRGFDMFWIVGADSIVAALKHMNQSPAMQVFTRQMSHKSWEGFTFHDLIFPLFVFIMGVSTVFSLTKIIQQEGKWAAVKRIIRRSLLLYVVALIYSGGLDSRWPDIRLLGVLNRIALCYLFGGLIFCFFRTRAIAVITATILLGYWAAMALIPFPDVRPPGAEDVPVTRNHYQRVEQLNMASTNMIHGVYLPGVDLSDYLDQKYLPGRKVSGTYDPEGLLSTLPAIASGLLGILAGLLLQNTKVTDRKKVIYLLACGAAGVVLGFLWGTQFPVIKKIWTSSFVMVAGGYSAILLGVFYLVVDVWKYQKWCQPFVWIGMNSITIYMVNNFLGGFDGLASRLAGGDVKAFFDKHVGQGFGELMIAIVGLGLVFWFVNFLYRKKVFIRL